MYLRSFGHDFNLEIVDFLQRLFPFFHLWVSAFKIKTGNFR